MNQSVGIRALAVFMPDEVRTNRHWPPAVVRDRERRTLARAFGISDDAELTAEWLEAEKEGYLPDAFRGTLERRVLKSGETPLDMEAAAVERALAAARMAREDVDLAIVASFPAQKPGVHLMRRLGLGCPVWDFEPECSSGLVAMDAATTFLRSGRHRNVLVVTSCAHSRAADEDDTLAWLLGDGAGAFLVTHASPGFGILGTDARHVTLLGECCERAAKSAGVELGDIDLFAFNAPTSWLTAACTRAFGVAADKTVNTFPIYANVGPALFAVNLHHAASEGRIGPGDLVLACAIGSNSNAVATVMRWEDVALGPAVPRSPMARRGGGVSTPVA